MRNISVPFRALVATVAIMCVVAGAGSADGLYYHSDGQVISLGVSTHKIAVRFEEGVERAAKELSVTSDPDATGFEDMDLPSGIGIVALRDGISEASIMRKLDTLTLDRHIKYVSPVFTHVSGEELAVTDTFIVSFKESIAEAEISSFNEAHGVTILKEKDYSKWPTRYLMQVESQNALNVLDTANVYAEDSRVAYAVPNFQRLNAMADLVPNDYWYVEQSAARWHLEKIQAPAAWDVQTGSSAITIAVIDSGMDYRHEDLSGNHWENAAEIAGVSGVDDDGNGYCDDAYGWDFYCQANDPDDLLGHGTLCAGLASAVGNNWTGVTGVTWNCRLMPVRIINFFGLSTTDDLIADAIDYAWENGADILSNSWHSSAPSTAITDAIHRAHILGRNGKGCVIAFSSSDDYTSPVAYPGSLPDVIAVGASYSYDVRCSFSNYGDNLDVVAPGDTTGSGQALWSTDITGLDFLFGGFNKILGTECWDNGNYHRYFTGTSAACPLVSGLAGLVLSQNADLTAIEVQAIIEFSCDDLVYSIQHEDPDWIELAPSGRDQYTGYGRINAADALALTQAARCRFRDADDGFLGSLDAAGNLILKQALSEAASSQDLEAHPGVAEVMVRDSSSSVARLDETGNIYLAGKLYERVLNDLDEQVSVPCLRIRDADGHTMALINAESISGTTIETHYPYIVPAGSLVLKGRAFVGADPDRESSQGH